MQTIFIIERVHPLLIIPMPVVITLYVKTGRFKQTIMLNSQLKLSISVTSHPEKGKANKEIIDFFAKILVCPKQKISIVSGYTSKIKKIIFETVDSQARLLQLLGLDNQITLLKDS